MVQQGQVLKMKSNGADGQSLWAYRYRVGGRDSRRVQRGGFVSERDAGEALERALERLRRVNGTASTLTLAELVDEYLAQHDAQPETIAKLHWLLTKAIHVFGDRRLGQLRPQEIAAWRMTISAGHRFEATASAAAGADARGAVGDDRRQPRDARCRQPTAAAYREEAVRIVGTTRRSRVEAQRSVWADGDVRERDRSTPRRVDRARAP
jgi:hypothetical protein